MVESINYLGLNWYLLFAMFDAHREISVKDINQLCEQINEQSGLWLSMTFEYVHCFDSSGGVVTVFDKLRNHSQEGKPMCYFKNLNGRYSLSLEGKEYFNACFSNERECIQKRFPEIHALIYQTPLQLSVPQPSRNT